MWMQERLSSDRQDPGSLHDLEEPCSAVIIHQHGPSCQLQMVLQLFKDKLGMTSWYGLLDPILT